jgi:hypothetical protein
MHRGVHDFIAWVEQHPDFPGLKLSPPPPAADITAVEERIASPLPADLRTLIMRFNGGVFPSGQLLSAGEAGEHTMLAALDELAKRLNKSVRDPELLFPFFRADDGGILAFDRSAGPVSDTWPILDYYVDSGEQRMVHRTFDGFCRLRVAEWTDPAFNTAFTLDSYLQSGLRHVAIEPDVSIAHATVAHALRRAGKPEEALEAYLRGAHCVPAQPWCDWEALKIAVILGDGRNAIEAASRVSSRAPRSRWDQRETTPLMVADVLAVIAPALSERRDQLLRIYDQLAEQCDDDADRQHVVAVRRAVFARELPPPPLPLRTTAVPPDPDAARFFSSLKEGYRRGKVRDEDMLLDPVYAVLRQRYDFAEVLRIPRGFS